MRSLAFTVIGVPQAQGSTRAFVPKGWTRPIITSTNPQNKGWRQTIATAASFELQRPEHASRLFAGPIALEVTFYLPRPKKFLTKRLAGADVPHTTRPDIDKLVRSAGDALTKIVWADDAQLTDLIARKRYCAEGEHPRAVIIVRETNPAGQLQEAS